MTQVDTVSGRIEGVLEEGIHRFLGVPYAASPTGERRFRPPQPATPWSGVAPATQFGSIAMQVVGGRASALGGGPDLAAEEDCLTLNVWTPGTAGSRPVLVWLHGGGYSVGSSARDLYNGANLARRNDVVVVSATVWGSSDSCTSASSWERSSPNRPTSGCSTGSQSSSG